MQVTTLPGFINYKLANFIIDNKEIARTNYSVIRLAKLDPLKPFVKDGLDSSFINKNVVIKELSSSCRQDLIQDEIKNHYILRHPLVLAMYGYFIESGKYYILLEYAPNGDLFSKFEQCQLKFSEEVALFYIKQIIQAVSYCHEKGIMHRDIKLENVFLDENNNIKLADFGFSCGTGLRRHSLCGTSEYLAPEMLKRSTYTYGIGICGYSKEIDLWSIGITFHVLLTGDWPLDRPQHISDLKAAAKVGSLSWDWKMPDGISKESQRLLSSLLQLDPNKRAFIG
jgi:serine/threonine protein kinase